eukprot:symbB.v1.2.037604.t1/scaffold5595.1/size25523/1
MTAAGQAMVVLVPIREKSAMTYINDTDAQLMGYMDEEKERLAQVDQDMKKEQDRKASDLAELREARRELRKSRGSAGKRGMAEAVAKSMKPEKGAPAIPSFMKVKSTKVAASSPTHEVEGETVEPEVKRPKVEADEAAPASAGIGLGGYASSSESEGDEEA